MKLLLKIVWCILFLYIMFIVVSRVLIDNWITNAQSEIVEILKPWKAIEMCTGNDSIRVYIQKNPHNLWDIWSAYYNLNYIKSSSMYCDIFPKEITENKWFNFILMWINKRKEFMKAVKEYSEKLWLEKNLVLSAILSEQVRISVKWARWKLKDIITNSTPTLFRSYNISLGIGWIKTNTARQVAKDAWFDLLYTDEELAKKLSDDDYFNWKIATYLVYNIIKRWKDAWYDISNNPWVVGTLYNMWNNKNKIPNPKPKIGWSIIDISWYKYSYGEISLWLYRMLNIYF